MNDRDHRHMSALAEIVNRVEALRRDIETTDGSASPAITEAQAAAALHGMPVHPSLAELIRAQDTEPSGERAPDAEIKRLRGRLGRARDLLRAVAWVDEQGSSFRQRVRMLDARC